MIQVNLDVMMAKAQDQPQRPCQKDGSFARQPFDSQEQTSAKRSGFPRFRTSCRILDCEVGDILVYTKGVAGRWTTATTSPDNRLSSSRPYPKRSFGFWAEPY
jgi:hypothetical protein